MTIDLNNFCIKKDENDPLWAEFKEWWKANTTDASTYSGTYPYLGKYLGGKAVHTQIEGVAPLITLQEWHEAVYGWEPKFGEEVEVLTSGWTKGKFCCPSPSDKHLFIIEIRGIMNVYANIEMIRPIKPSLRDQLRKFIQVECSWHVDDSILDQIISMVKNESKS